VSESRDRAIYEYYWLRPENALWRARDFQLLDSVELTEPCLDFGAGDGAFSFIRAGGEFSLEHDAFSEIRDTSKFYEGGDIYDQTSKEIELLIRKNASYKIDTAFDVKENLLAKAKKLNFYNHEVKGDGNKRLPFEDQQFQTIFSNIIYWLTDPLSVTVELCRVLRNSGKIVLLVPSENLANYSFYKKYFLDQGGPESLSFLKMLDFGRIERNIKISRDSNGWEEIFKLAGMKTIERKSYISGALVRLWDVGLRPFSPFLVEMANHLDPISRAKIKKRWVDETYPLFSGFLSSQETIEKGEPNAFFLYVLEKSFK